MNFSFIFKKNFFFKVDHLYTKNQTILYNMLEWPQQPYSKLIVIAIANTLDLPETMFKKKLQSRLVSLVLVRKERKDVFLGFESCDISSIYI
jgi:hypothetical protein